MKYFSGEKGNYYWLEFSSSEVDLTCFVKNIPHLLIGRYIAIICFDGGIFMPSEEELNRGWYKKEEITYSPIINEKELNGPIYECHDQWCLFENKTEFKKMTDFVNYGGFTLRDREEELKSIDPTWCIEAKKHNVRCNKDLQDKFWKEVKDINVDSVIINGDSFIFCSKHKHEVEEVKSYFGSIPNIMGNKATRI